MARYDMDRKPESLAELETMIERAQEELNALCNGKRFQMRVPVDDTDSDMVIGDALRHSLAFVRAALGKPLRGLRVDPVDGRGQGDSKREKDSSISSSVNDLALTPEDPQEQP